MKKFKPTRKKGESFVTGRLTGHRRAQTDGTFPVQVVGGVRLVVDGMWVKGNKLMCHLPIE
jgi:hypothetical protein